MKLSPFFIFAFLMVSACSRQPDVVIRVDCGEFNNKGVQASVNGKIIGECPVDLSVHSGTIEITARKENDDASYLFAKAKMTLAENAMKRIKLDVQPVYTEEFYFRKATDLEGAEDYLKNISEGPRRSSIEALKEKLIYENASNETELKNYLELYPSGKYLQVAKDKLEHLIFSNAKSISDIEAFIKNFPDGKLASTANKKLNELKNQEAKKLKVEKKNKEQLEKATPFKTGQLWRGFYYCAQGKTNLILKIRSVQANIVRANFEFDTSKVEGAFELIGEYNHDKRTLIFKPERWIRQPNGFNAVGMEGKFNSSATEFSGVITDSNCGDFRISR